MDYLSPPPHAAQLTAFHTWMGEDGICRTVVKPGAEVDLSCAKENSSAVNGFYNGRKFPLLIDSRAVKSISSEARRFLSTNGRETSINSMGFIVKSPLSRVIGNFFMTINRPAVPARLFDSESSAIEWLKKFI